ncbi:MAG: hypothetical protein EAX96_16510 [Candidatus Lokiarchaeota archaeon]|nr:hypothetical protein [Candidatus Lokiarchaeota archaeon]
MSMTVKAPNPDDVFDKWLQRAPPKKLENFFAVKGVKFEKGNISKAKYVKNIVDSVVFYFQAKIEDIRIQKNKAEEVIIFPKNIKKVEFFEFGSNKVNPKTWKGNDIVPIESSIKKVSCENKKCTSGYIKCENCKGEGRISCRKCKGKGTFTCSKCAGSGFEEVEISVISYSNSKENKLKKTIKHQCPICFGSGKQFCKDCNGEGFQVCDKCKGDKRTTCKQCAGYGFSYQYRLIPVPFGVPTGPEKYEPYLFFNKDIEKAIKEDLAEEINQAKVQGIQIKDIKNLDEKFVKANLGNFDKEIGTRMKDCKSTWAKLENSGIESPMFPIYMFPVIEMDVITPTNKKFSIFSIGTDKGYVIYSPRFK